MTLLITQLLKVIDPMIEKHYKRQNKFYNARRLNPSDYIKMKYNDGELTALVTVKMDAEFSLTNTELINRISNTLTDLYNMDKDDITAYTAGYFTVFYNIQNKILPKLLKG